MSERDGSLVAWVSLASGLASAATLPLAIYLTRFSESYDLLHAGFAIPIAVAFGVVGLVLARRVHRSTWVTLAGPSRSGVATTGRVLAVIGLCIAAAAVVALAVYGLLEYVGSRD